MASPRRITVFALAATVILAVSVPLVIGSGDQPVPPDTPPAAQPVQVSPPTQPAGNGVSWDETLNVRLPVSDDHGPRHIQDGRAWGFSRTESGTGFAAAHLVARTSPSVGPAVFSATLAEQVRGPNRIAMEQLVTEEYEQHRQRAGVHPGEPIPGADAEFVGYRADGYDPDGAQVIVQLVLASPELRASGRFLAVLATVQWADQDWQLVAPPQGDWGTVSRVLSTPPAGMVVFGKAT